MALFPSRGDWRDARVRARVVTDNSADMHAGELETSILLHVIPEAVRPGFENADYQADNRPLLLTLGMRGYTASGVIGRPSLATAEKGKKRRSCHHQNPPIESKGRMINLGYVALYLNPGLLTEAFFPAEAIWAAGECAPNGIPFGDADATQACAAEVLTAFGIDGSSLNPDALGRLPDPLGLGAHNCALVFRGPSNASTRAQIRELEALVERSDWAQTAARILVEPPLRRQQITADSDAAAGAERTVIAVDGLRLNDAQEQAVAKALTNDLTVVTGPPGTGKSQLVSAVVVNQWMSGEPVLVASTNNGAVDVAVRRCADIDPALLIRTGNRDARDALVPQLEKLARRGGSTGPTRRAIDRRVFVAVMSRNNVLDRLARRTRLEGELAQLVLDVEQRRLVLWATPNAKSTLGDTTKLAKRARRVAKTRWAQSRRGRALLRAIAVTATGATAADVAAWAEAECEIANRLTQLDELGPGDADRDRRDLEEATTSWAQAGTNAINDLVRQRLHAGRAALQQLAQIRPGASDARAEAVARAIGYLPGWACTALSAQQNFPLRPAIFDLLILDEASQCAIADVLPLAYRARRILIVGDPNQLTPIVTLSNAALTAIAAGVGARPDDLHADAMSVGKDSAFTAYAARSTETLLLDEHYRCHPDVARFINQRFYGAVRDAQAIRTVDDDRMVQLLSPLAARNGFRRGDGAALWDHLTKLAGTDIVTTAAAIAASELGALVTAEYLTKQSLASQQLLKQISEIPAMQDAPRRWAENTAFKKAIESAAKLTAITSELTEQMSAFKQFVEQASTLSKLPESTLNPGIFPVSGRRSRPRRCLWM